MATVMETEMEMATAMELESASEFHRQDPELELAVRRCLESVLVSARYRRPWNPVLLSEWMEPALVSELRLKRGRPHANSRSVLNRQKLCCPR